MMNRVNVSYEVIAEYSKEGAVYINDFGRYQSLPDLLFNVCRFNCLPINLSSVEPFEYDIKDLDSLSFLKKSCLDLNDMPLKGTLFMNRQFIFFENDVFVEKHKFIINDVDVYDWVVSQIN